MTVITPLRIALVVGLSLAQSAQAEEQELSDAVLLELNAVKSTEAGCTMSFLIVNAYQAPIEKAIYETVLFDANGQVDRLTLFDFGTLPPGRPRVRQFTVPGVACDGLGQVLINGAHSCEAPDLAEEACEAGLILESRTEIEVTG